MSEKKAIIMLLVLVLVFFVGFSFVSASFSDWFSKITGQATQQGTNATVTVAGTTIISINVLNETLTGSSVIPTEDTSKIVTFTVNVDDPDGVNDISVMLKSVVNGLADLTISKIEIGAQIVTKEEEIARGIEKEDEIKGEKILVEETITPPEKANKSWLLVILVIVILAVGIYYKYGKGKIEWKFP